MSSVRVRSQTRKIKRAAILTDAFTMRLLLPLLLAALVAGCGSGPVEDEALNRQLVTDTVLSWHRLQGEHDPAACELATDETLDRMLEFHRKLAADLDQPPPRDCAAMISGLPASDSFTEFLANTVVDSVSVDGDRATATVHTSAVVGGVSRATPPARLELRWDDGRWRVD